jgi:hypothetical protein
MRKWPRSLSRRPTGTAGARSRARRFPMTASGRHTPSRRRSATASSSSARPLGTPRSAFPSATSDDRTTRRAASAAVAVHQVLVAVVESSAVAACSAPTVASRSSRSARRSTSSTPSLARRPRVAVAPAPVAALRGVAETRPRVEGRVRLRPRRPSTRPIARSSSSSTSPISRRRRSTDARRASPRRAASGCSTPRAVIPRSPAAVTTLRLPAVDAAVVVVAAVVPAHLPQQGDAARMEAISSCATCRRAPKRRCRTSSRRPSTIRPRSSSTPSLREIQPRTGSSSAT